MRIQRFIIQILILLFIEGVLVYAENAQQSNQIHQIQNVNILNCRADDFSNKLDLIKISKRDSYILLIGSSLALLIQGGFVLFTFKVPRLRTQPGDILLGAFCAESILSIHWLMMSIEAILNPNGSLHRNDAFCVLNSIISIIGSSLQGLYNFIFFLFIGFSIKNSLKIQSISRRKTHIFTVSCSLTLVTIVLLFNMNGKTLYGTCSYVSDQSVPMASSILYLLFLCFAIIILIYFNHKIPNTTFYKKKRQEFLNFSRLYLSFCLLMWGILALSNTTLFMNCQYFHLEDLAYFQTIGNATKVISSIILPLIRLQDPYLRSIIKQQQKLLKKKLGKTIVPIFSTKASHENQLSSIENSDNQNDNTIPCRNQQSLLTSKSKSIQQSSFDLDGIISYTKFRQSYKQEQMQKLSQKYKDQRNKLSCEDDLTVTNAMLDQFRNSQNELSEKEIDLRLSIFNRMSSSEKKPHKNKLESRNRFPSYLPPILSAPSGLSDNTGKGSRIVQNLGQQNNSKYSENFRDFFMQYNKKELNNDDTQLQNINNRYSQNNRSNSVSKDNQQEGSIDQDMSLSFIKQNSLFDKKDLSLESNDNESPFNNKGSPFLKKFQPFDKKNTTSNLKKDQPFISQATPIMQPIPEINVIQPDDKYFGNLNLETPDLNYEQKTNLEVPQNLKLLEFNNNNNILQRKKLSVFNQQNIKRKEGKLDSYLSQLDQSRSNSKVFFSRRHDFRKTLNQERNKQKLHSKLFQYMQDTSLQNEIIGSENNDENVEVEDYVLQEKLKEMIKNAHMMEYFNDPYYRYNPQSQSGSYSDIDQVFGESTSSGSSMHQNIQLQAETIEGNKEHFIRILQRNIKMGVLCRMLCGIQIQFQRKKRYCTKLDIFYDTYSSIFKSKIDSSKLNKNSSALSSKLNSIRPSRTGIYEQSKTQPENKQDQNTQKQKQISNKFTNINDDCNESNQSIDYLQAPSYIVYSDQINTQNQYQKQFSLSESNRIQSKSLSQIDWNRCLSKTMEANQEPQRSQTNQTSQAINLRQVSLALEREKSNSRSKKQKKQDENDIFYEVKIFQFSDDTIKSNLQNAPTQLLESDTFDLVRMRVYAPTVFHSLSQTDIQNLIENGDEKDFSKVKNIIDIEKSFNISDNMAQIKNLSGSDGGKSGQFFFFSHDNKFLLKTLSQNELKILLERLPSYFRYLKANPRSLIAKIFGVYTFEELNENPIHIVLMKNIAACNKQFIERTYDLKGSTFDREVLAKSKKESEKNSKQLNKMILKDLDFVNLEKKIYISLEDKHKIFAQLRKDAEFLSSCGWIDYSLIVFKVNKNKLAQIIKIDQLPCLEDEEDIGNQLTDFYQLESSVQKGMYYHIDYLQLYDMQKRLEKFAKRFIHFNPKLDTSSQDPDTYSKRFINFMKQILDV